MILIACLPLFVFAALVYICHDISPEDIAELEND